MEVYVRNRKPNLSFRLIAIPAFAFAAGFALCYGLFARTQTPTPTEISEAVPSDQNPASSDSVPADSTESSKPPASISGDPAEPQTPPSEIDALEDLWPARHLIVSVQGVTLDEPTKALLADLKPGGVLLNAANIESKEQTIALVAAIKQAVGLGTDLASLPIIVADDESEVLKKLGLKKDLSAPEVAKTCLKQNDLEFARMAGRTVGAICAEAGIGALLGPSLDIYEPSAGDAMKAKTFGSDSAVVTAVGLAFADGLTSAGVIPVVKHYPGMGGCPEDLNEKPALIKKSTYELAGVVFPFQQAASAKIPGILVSHIQVPVLDEKSPERPASLSPVIVGRNVREETWDYRGVVLADDVSLGSISKNVPPEKAVVAALKAGCDAAIIQNATPEGIHAVCAAIEAAVAAGDAAPSAAAQPAPGAFVEDNPTVNRVALSKSKKRLDGWQQWLRTPSRLEGALPKLPGKEGAAATADATTPEGSVEPGTEIVHVVAKGDMLSKIASKYDVTTKQIMQWNGLKKTSVRVGQKLKIYPAGEPKAPEPAPAPEEPAPAPEEPAPAPAEPAPAPAEPAPAASPESGVPPTAQPPDEEPPHEATAPAPQGTKALSHKVKRGESLGSIAKKYNVTYQDVMEWNGLPDTKLQVDQLLVVNVPQDFALPEDSASEEQTEAPSTETAPEAPSANAGTYTVERGDNLSKIADKFGITADDLRTWNALENDSLQVGDTLRVVAPAAP